MEIWKPIKDYEGYYEISTLGRVRSLHKRNSGKIMSRSNHSIGYLVVGLCKKGKAEIYLIHRLMAFTFLGLSDDKLTVNHINGIKSDNRLENLELLTHSQNNYHGCRLGLFTTKLSFRKAENIRKRFKNGERNRKKLASAYGVSSVLIGYVLGGKIWNPRDYEPKLGRRAI